MGVGAVSMACVRRALPWVAGPSAHTQCSPRVASSRLSTCPGHAGDPMQQGHPEGMTGPVLDSRKLLEMGIQTHQQPLSPHPGTWAKGRKGHLWPRPPSGAGSDPHHCMLCKGRDAGEPVTGPLCGKAW